MDKEYILSLSYGKDSLRCLGAIKELGLPLHRIITADIWRTKDIPADYPPMVEFKTKADKWILDNFGIEVEHIRADKTYEDCFYLTVGGKKKKSKYTGRIYGFPMIRGRWCNSRLKVLPLKSIKGIVYLGIASDEPTRVERHQKRDGIILPLVEIGWTEADCWKWCEDRGLLSPIYTTATRGGCWFCHNQSIGQLRLLRKNYPEYWRLLLKWDKDSPVSFKPDGRTIHDFDRRFQLEDEGFITAEQPFRWSMLDNPYIQLEF